MTMVKFVSLLIVELLISPLPGVVGKPLCQRFNSSMFPDAPGNGLFYCVMKENWKKINGFNYEVSSIGRVRSMKTGKVLKAAADKLGYMRHGLCKNGKRTMFKLHRLVADAFVPNPHGKPEVNHKDGDKQNNAASNLEWCTRKENMNHAYTNGMIPAMKGQRNGQSKLKKDDVFKIKSMLKNGGSCASIARFFGVDRTLVSKIKHGKNWNHL